MPFFEEVGYIRRRCPRCGDHFWTQDQEQRLCGEANEHGCAVYTFITNPPTRRSYQLREMRETFLSFFERRCHTIIKPYPVVARWRDDLFFTHASIVDFQPYVTNGEIPPPANPLVISQPCLRFVDLDNVGPTFGRHLTIFEMGGHHAFNYPNKEVYWKDGTIRFHHEFVTEELGVRSEEVLYKEGIWSGGGNAGPCLESVVRGLELATLVFMKFKVLGDELIELPIRTVDTGYGIERYTWLSQGTYSCFHSIYGDLLEEVLDEAVEKTPDPELLLRLGELSGLMNLEKRVLRNEARRRVASEMDLGLCELENILRPIESAFAVTDHTKSLSFMLAEGIVPSNVREGYLTRLMIRRTYRLLKELKMEDRFLDIMDSQIDYWSRDFPHIGEMREEILDILKSEIEKFRETLSRGRTLIKRMAMRLKEENRLSIPKEDLIELYDSHGMPPEIVKETAMEDCLHVEIPDDFYKTVAERHITATVPTKKKEEIILEEFVAQLPETKRLYYGDMYLKEFEAKVLKVFDGKRVVLDATAFYPEGGGEPSDRGFMEFEGMKIPVIDVQMVGNVIIHTLKGRSPPEGARVRGSLDWDYRYQLMRNHTATHLVLGAARRVLGRHVWQSGAQKGAESSRLDISHYKRLTTEEVHEIERVTNMAVMSNVDVESVLMPREEAERLYGFSLYQGGVVPGRKIRVIKIRGWDVEACGGMHCSRTGEIGPIKIVHTERIQDGVERIIFRVGPSAIKALQEMDDMLMRISKVLNTPVEEVETASIKLSEEEKRLRKRLKNLEDELSTLLAKRYLDAAILVKEVRVISDVVSGREPELMIKVANEIVSNETSTVVVFVVTDGTARVIVRIGDEALKRGLDARVIANRAAAAMGGGGSGRVNFAQGGGRMVNKAQEALRSAVTSLREQLGG